MCQKIHKRRISFAAKVDFWSIRKIGDNGLGIVPRNFSVFLKNLGISLFINVASFVNIFSALLYTKHRLPFSPQQGWGFQVLLVQIDEHPIGSV